MKTTQDWTIITGGLNELFNRPNHSTIELPQSKSNHLNDTRYFIVAHDRQDAFGNKEFNDWLIGQHISHKLVLGRYQGVFEHSWIINAEDWIKVRDSGFIDNQYTVLYLWPFSYGEAEYGRKQRKATLYYLNGYPPTELGTLQAVNELDLKADQDYSYVDEMFWITRKE